ncbi:unnamed protein product [Fusarium graminearum]|uniref:Uncharacterized protein n=1 Tax=Gibberella zeae TaxID=5518 RepID=A0A2H3GUU6_GIBZA|nr:hypothetical protein FG05_08812 [Fusarium graminearum]PCD33816.1 hypothetical protein FGRA07_08971 [Fusarium graminearum]CAF3431594.1 unnamed protein product [Fusarium graminearum]CAF3477235.1 unnamed protein product [Fusarium graminearum]CAG1959816.1 unnamed protein product [Fusarium graminearum]
MISRAVRVPRISLACRFGLITQRSAGLGFRTNPVREGLGRRLYTSDLGTLGDSKVEPFVSNKDTSETISEGNLGENESTTTIPSTDATESNNSDPATEINLESTTTSQEKPIGSAQTELDGILDQASPSTGKSDYGLSELSDLPGLSSKPSSDSSDHELDDLLNEAEPKTHFPGNPSGGVSELPDLPELSSERSDSVFELDELLGARSTRTESEFGISELPGLDDGLSRGVRGTIPWPKRRFRDGLMHDAPLGVPSLGLPADAIIINNPNKTRIERSPVVVEEEEVAPENFNWESLNPSVNIEPEVEEINANIEELRPDTRILRLTDIGTLVESLCSGFTINQLKDYHRDRVPEQEEGEIVNYTWIEGSVPWASVNSVRVRGTDKTAIAQKIVFDKWRIEAMEYENDLGKAYVWMDPEIFPFLLYGPNNISRLLWVLRRDFLVGEDEKLTLTIERSRINITARKSTTYGVLAYMDQCFQDMRSRTIDVAPFLPPGTSSPKPAELKELGRLTKTSIKRVREGTKEKYRVSWLPDSDEAPAETEDVADMVFRLMVGLRIPGTHNVLQCIPSKGEDEVSGQFVSVQRQTRAMSWRDKLGRWFRVVDPITKSSWSAKEPSPLNLAASADLPEWDVSGPVRKDTTTATFGHILHSEPLDSMKLLSRKRHILLPFIPHPAAFSALKPEDDDTLNETTTIIMNLVPREERKRGRSSDAQKEIKEPAVRIRIPVKPDADFVNFSLPDDMTAESLVTWHVNDLLLPTEAVDVRLQHERSETFSIFNRGVKKFLKASQFNLAEGKLRTPAQATINISGIMLSGSRTDSSTSKSKNIVYDFRGIEIHKTVEMPWRGHTLRYSSIEAGQQGGQRQEITLEAGPPGGGPAKFHPERRQSFLQLVEDMATGKCFSWYDGHKSIKSRQLEDYSYNLPEKELTDDIIVEDIFDAKGRPKSVERERKQRQDTAKQERAIKKQASSKSQAASKSDRQWASSELKREPILDDISKLLAAKNDSSLDPAPRVEEVSNEDGLTQELMAIIDAPLKSRAAAVGRNNKATIVSTGTTKDEIPKWTTEGVKQVPADEDATKDRAPDNQDSSKDAANASPTEKAAPTKSKKSAAETERDRVRTEIMNNFFGAEEIKIESSATSDNKKPSAARKAKITARKYTVPDLEQPAKKTKAKGKGNNKAKAKVVEEVDPFLAQFATRATSNNRTTDPNATPGFFDTPPPESQPKMSKSTERSRNGGKRGGKKRS